MNMLGLMTHFIFLLEKMASGTDKVEHHLDTSSNKIGMWSRMEFRQEYGGRKLWYTL